MATYNVQVHLAEMPVVCFRCDEKEAGRIIDAFRSKEQRYRTFRAEDGRIIIAADAKIEGVTLTPALEAGKAPRRLKAWEE